jgi:hypothetical protein
VLRLLEAGRTHLHPDEALILQLSLPADIARLLAAAGEAHHPPLGFLALHGVSRLTFSEFGLRLPFLAAGSLLPWAMFAWLRRIAGDGAALCAAAMLAFSPSLVALAAAMRAYLPALLFSALALYLLDTALDHRSARRMAAFAVCLWLAALSEYSAAWFAGGAGVYGLLRIREGKGGRAPAAVWAAAQVVALSLYALLYFTVMRGQLDAAAKAPLISGYLAGAFPRAGETPAAFAWRGTLDQFAWLFYTPAAAVPALALFLAGLVWLARRRGAVVALCAMPFALACAAAWLRLFPYGRSRHTAILSLFIAAGAGVALDRLLRARAGWLVAVAAPLAVLALASRAAPALVHLHQNVQRRDAMLEAVAHLRRAVPAGETLLTDRKTALLLNYYLCGDRMRTASSATAFLELEVCGYRADVRAWSNSDGAMLREHLLEFRRRHRLEPERGVWVVDAGFDVSVLERLRAEPAGLVVTRARQFDGAAAVFRVSQ